MKNFLKKDEYPWADVTITVTGKHSDFDFFNEVSITVKEALRSKQLFNGIAWGDFSDKNKVTDIYRISKEKKP